MDSNTALCPLTSQERYVRDCAEVHKPWSSCDVRGRGKSQPAQQTPATPVTKAADVLPVTGCAPFTNLVESIHRYSLCGQCNIATQARPNVTCISFKLDFLPPRRSSEMQSYGVMWSQWRRPNTCQKSGTGLLSLDSQPLRSYG